MPEKFVVDGESVRGLARLLEETGLTEIEYQVGTQRIRIARSSILQTTLPHSASLSLPSPSSSTETPASAEAPTSPGETISSPMVGTVYLSDEPGSAPFIKVGDFVKKGDTLLIIEAMKVMNPIRAAQDGEILEICVQDTKPVEFGEPLIIFK
jgi:acetyl-CoA carboxylase biotin carboxyl carrier protein